MSPKHRPNGTNRDALRLAWKAEPEVTITRTAGGLRFTSASAKPRTIILKKPFLLNNREEIHLELDVEGQVVAGTGVGVVICANELDHQPAPIGSRNTMPLTPRSRVELKVKLGPRAELLLTKLDVRFVEKSWSIAEFVKLEHRVLLVTPLFPASDNLYSCAFVLTRAREYIAAGIEPLVACTNWIYGYQSIYEIDGVQVLRGNLVELARILDRQRYDKVLVHFFDEHYGLALLRSRPNQRTDTYLFCHGAETLFREFAREAGPYFAALPPVPQDVQVRWRARQHAIELFNNRPNTTWVFVSDWQRRASEQSLGMRFEVSDVITNEISAALFPFQEKAPELRKKIFFLRRFNYERHYSIDVAIETVLWLSSRPGFEELEFHFYGDGPAFDEFSKPLRAFANVHLHRGFLEQQRIAEAHSTCGVALFPAHFDNTGVSGCEAASSGLAVLTSNVGGHPEFLPAEVGLFAEHDEPEEYAQLIEKLVRSPGLFERARREQADKVRDVCGRRNTIEREIALIRRPSTRDYVRSRQGAPQAKKLLTVIVPVYNTATYLERCLLSVLRVPAPERLEVLVVDDGSTDDSLQVAKELERSFPDMIRAISKPNGGHGSVINRGIREATGAFVRLLDSDDWYDTANFATLLERLEGESADVVLTNYSEDRVVMDQLQPQRIYDSLRPGRLYTFDVLQDPLCGFRGWGPVLATSTYRATALKAANIELPEKTAYVDMLFNVLALEHVRTLRYWDLDIYRYYIGRTEQTISIESIRKRFRERERIILGICDFLEGCTNYGAAKKAYALRCILKPLVYGQFWLLRDELKDADRLAELKSKLERYDFAPLPAPERMALPSRGVRLKQDADRVARKALKGVLPHAMVEAAPDFSKVDVGLMKSVAKQVVPHALWSLMQEAKRRVEAWE